MNTEENVSFHSLLVMRSVGARGGVCDRRRREAVSARRYVKKGDDRIKVLLGLCHQIHFCALVMPSAKTVFCTETLPPTLQFVRVVVIDFRAAGIYGDVLVEFCRVPRGGGRSPAGSSW